MLAVSAGRVLASAVDLEFNTREGVVRQRLDRCAAAPFELDCSPVRNFPSFRGQRNYPGLWWFATTGTHVGHESWVERDQLMALDADPTSLVCYLNHFGFTGLTAPGMLLTTSCDAATGLLSWSTFGRLTGSRAPTVRCLIDQRRLVKPWAGITAVSALLIRAAGELALAVGLSASTSIAHAFG